jgi:mannose-1-phosphate guanylyltransferase
VSTAPRYIVVLAGGVGSRFWPLSTPTAPKQLLPLISQRTMLAETVARVAPMVGEARVIVLTSESLAPSIRRELPMLGAEQILEEPRAAGTAAALAYAAREIQRRAGDAAVMISVHADWAIGDDAKFRAALEAAAKAAEREQALCTVGIIPTAPNPGLGYIEPGGAAGSDAKKVARFLEKPDRARAEQLVKAGCLWNSGIFAWRVGDYLAEVRALTPEVATALDEDDRRAFFAAVKTPVSVDVGVLERSTRVIVMAGDFGWNDVGTWGALRAVRALDADGNANHGTVHAVASRNNVVHAPTGRVVLYGVEDLVVVVKDGITLVTSVERSADLKSLLDALPADVVATS